MKFRHIAQLLLVSLTLATCVEAQRRVQPGPWAKSKIPPGWIVHKTKNYEIQSQAGKEKAVRLGKHMDAINMVYRKLFKPDKGGKKQQVIKLFKDKKQYHRYGGPRGSGAYYYRAEREMVCYDTGLWMDDSDANVPTTGKRTKAQKRIDIMKSVTEIDTLGCAAHEGWHQYFSWLVVSYVELPSWLNEGMGDYFYAAKPREKPTRRKPADLGLINKMRLGVIRAALRQDRWVPIPELLQYAKSQYYSNPSVCYAEGWLLCQFLLESDNKKYNKIIPTFIKLVKNDTNMPVVTAKAFKGIDLEKLDQEVIAYSKTLKLPGEAELEAEEAAAKKKAEEEAKAAAKKAAEEAKAAAKKAAAGKAGGADQ
ncbi:MAG: DUF1570 domain-containing protein [bacterium]|nr:DUF1570 domain-containing protein [bacterium]